MNRGAVLALVLLSLAGTTPLHADSYTSISGTIQDPSGASVPEAAISVVDEDTGFRRTAVSEQDGSYVVVSLRPGSYKVSIRKMGFRTMIRFGVKLSDAQGVRLDFKLVVGSIQDTITVEGTEAPWSSSDPTVATAIGRNAVENLPVNGSTLLGLLELTPGLVITPATRGESGQFTVDGQRPNTHYFTVDGVSANSGVSGGGLPAQSTGGSLPGMTAFGSLDSTSALGGTEEIRVAGSSSGAEFGRLPGAQVAVSSRSGTNQLHGLAQYGFRNEFLNANDWFANQQGDPIARERLQNIEAGLGGPLWRNHTFFFVAYQRERLTQPFVYQEPVPSALARATSPAWTQPVLNLFPAANGPDLGGGLARWTGGFSRPSGLDTGSLRMDQAVGSRVLLFGRYSDTSSDTEFGSSAVNFLDLRSKSVTLGMNLRARTNLVFDLRANASFSQSNSVWRENAVAQPPSECNLEPLLAYVLGPAGSCSSLVRLTIAGVGQVVSGQEGRRSQSQYQIGQTGGWDHRSHALRFGGDYLRLAPMRRDAAGTVSLIADSLRDLTDSSSFWKALSPAQSTSGVLRQASVFAQDTWQITRRLTATLGLRWEISPAPVTTGQAKYFDPASGVVSTEQRPLWNSSYANFAPRVGLAYRLTGDGRTVIRGGWGIYFDSSLSLATDLVNDGPLNVSEYGSARSGIAGTFLDFAFLPNLRLPKITEWNVSIARALTGRDVLSVGYAGSKGEDLVRREVNGPGSSDRLWVALATNHGASDYQSLQVQYRRRLAGGLEGLASYAWSHSIDNGSTDAGLYWLDAGLSAAQERASSDFDVRQTLTAGVTYQLPVWHWALDGMFRARTGFPLDVQTAGQYQGIPFENTFRPNLVGGVPVWVDNAVAAGGRVLNQAAFLSVGSVQGNLGRNALNGFGMSQLDLALSREFSLGEQRALRLRVEAFNAFNHANFADPVRYLISPLFGQSTSMLNLMLGTGSPGSGLTPMFQAGGARTLQVSLRFRF